ncbi:HD-GYP domain-containing protein [Porticoccus sp. W117]|uniref:HD-GYP domain-containing protein n=1 Tax=Porticoccus sp. W117 TaxID=3054777 RepID=UPI0025991431|nr:HD-GYP domain-containing protein [Porticoccus sp. W117]MDM3870367.1 HD-GYP domain-containing protein [Porticoccus sp. W117]
MASNPFLSQENLVQVPVSQLAIGMFVAELDRPWLETPFLLQGFAIRHPAEIRKLSEYCDFVYIEKEGRNWGSKNTAFMGEGRQQKKSRSRLENTTRSTSSSYNTRDPKSLVNTLKTRAEHKSTVPPEQEHQNARELYAEATGSVTSILDQVRLKNMVDTRAARSTVRLCVDSILRNPAALGWMSKIKDMNKYTAEHCLNVCILAIAFGRHLRLPEAELEKLGLCGLLHDVGKVKIADEILNKPGKLTPQEFEVMKSHTTVGRDLLRQSDDVDGFAVDVAFSHHEQMDGKGYPRRVRAHELTEYSRIIAIVDAFDAMTSDRCYSEAKSTLDALKEVYRCRGSQFDPELALEFISLIGPYPAGTIVELHNGLVGIVLHSKKNKRHLPAVQIIRDHEEVVEPYKVDILETETGDLGAGYLVRRVLKNGDRGIKLEDYPVRMLLRQQVEDSD